VSKKCTLIFSSVVEWAEGPCLGRCLSGDCSYQAFVLGLCAADVTCPVCASSPSPSPSPSSVSVSVSVSVHRSQSKSQSQRVLVWQPASKFEPTNKAATKHMAQILLRRKSQRHRRPKERQPHNKSGRKMGHVNLPFWSYNHECRMSLGKSKIILRGFKNQIY